MDALSVQSELNTDGRIDDFKVIAGERSPGVDQWLQELVLFSQFKPATHWGLPVRSPNHSFICNCSRLIAPATAFTTRSATFPPRS